MKELRSSAIRYPIAAATFAAALAIRLALTPIWKDKLVFITFYGAVMISVWYGGLGPGLLCLGLVVAASLWLWVDLTPADSADTVSLVGFIAVALLTILLANALHRARRRIEASAVALRANATALKESERHFRAITDMISDYAFTCGVEPDGRVVTEWVSQAFTRTMGYDLGDLNSTPWEPRVPGDDRASLLLHAKRVAGGEPDTFECRLLTKRGEPRWLRVNVRPEWDPAEDRVVRLYGSAQDITDRKMRPAEAL